MGETSEEPAGHVPAPQPPEKRPGLFSRVPWWGHALICAALGTFILGFFHIVHGGRIGFPPIILEKESWSLDETFVDVDDYSGRSRFEIVARGDGECLRVLERNGIISFDRDDGH
jgi:hypothetical protein